MAGAEKSEVLKNFLATLAENNRLSVLEGVCEKFATLMGAHRGEIVLNITSAQVWDILSSSGVSSAIGRVLLKGHNGFSLLMYV